MTYVKLPKIGEADAAVINHVTDLYYLTQLNLSRGLLLITKKEMALFVDGRYLTTAQEQAPCPVHLWEGGLPMGWLRERKVKTLEFDSATTNYDQFLALQTAAEGIQLIPKPGLLKKHRGIKQPHEIAALKQAAAVTWKGYQHIASLLKEGISEKELALEFEFCVRRAGASELSFEPIVAFGGNSAYPHHRA
ncbi:MAG: aminopeptidase P family protein, partial [Verrucomicrobiota bacterium]|nr:aminopeptidase P family protein [Verrucomicrobiota bacterium]